VREPLFRGVSKETNEWVYGFGWFKTDYTEEYLKALGKIEQAVLYTNRGPILCYLDSMGEWTGLRDNKKTDEFPDGQMIFEGDIVRFHYKTGVYKIGTVVWNDLFGSWDIDCSDFVSYKSLGQYKSVSEIIGNIYEDKHLLEAMK
jgi:uncharacterized phage protein (TIGR01671 family)